jgi:hypothetical protein
VPTLHGSAETHHGIANAAIKAITLFSITNSPD